MSHIHMRLKQTTNTNFHKDKMSQYIEFPFAVLKVTFFEIRIGLRHLLNLSYFVPKIIFESVLGNLKSPDPMSDSYLSSLFIATKFSYLAVTLNGIAFILF